MMQAFFATNVDLLVYFILFSAAYYFISGLCLTNSNPVQFPIYQIFQESTEANIRKKKRSGTLLL
jgi:hypothetical protein